MKERERRRPHTTAGREPGQQPQPEHPAAAPTNTIYDRSADRAAKITAALQTLEVVIASLTDSESFKQYLTAMSRLHQYSFGNLCLILAQRRDAKMVAGYRAWQALGRHVKRGEKGIAILVPHRVKIDPQEEGQDPVYVVRNFGIGYVWDISQTEGEELPQPPRPELLTGASEAAAALYRRLERFATAQGASVIRRDTGAANGWYIPHIRAIAIHHTLSGDQAAKTLAHEVAHFTAEHNHFVPKEDAETIAGASAFVVLSHAGIDTSQYSFPYITLWAKDKDVLRRNLAGIQKTVTTIISCIEDLEEVQGEGGAPVVAEEASAPRATDPSPFPTGDETQVPLFESEVSGTGNTEDPAAGGAEEYVVTFDGVRHHVRRRRDWQIVAADLSEEEAVNERIRRQYGGWEHYPGACRTERGEARQTERNNLIRSLLLDYARAKLRHLTEKDGGRCPHCGVPAVPSNQDAHGVCRFCGGDEEATPF